MDYGGPSTYAGRAGPSAAAAAAYGDQYYESEGEMMDRSIQEWPGETAATLGSTSTMELLHGPSLISEPSSSGKAPKQKRNRSALSCAECRRLKLRCSREPWPCSNCVKRKCAQVCPDDVLKEIRPSRNKEVGALQDRIRELEAQVAELSASHSQSRPATASEPFFANASAAYDYSTGASLPLEAGYETDALANLARTSSRPASIKDEHQYGASDVAEVMGTLLLGDDGSSRYLGKSAANALFHDDGSDEEDGASIGSEEEEEIANNLAMRLQGTAFPMVSRGLEVEDFQAMLPPLSEARYLAEAYYTNSGYMFEPLKREVFEKHLRDAYDFGADPPLPLEQLALVFTVLALGVAFNLNTDIRDARSPKYHSIAQACLTTARFLNVPSLASIQCLHLMSTWQLITHSQTGAFRSWPLLGLAGRMVLSTGIHRDPSIWAIPEPHLTIRRWLFWEIVSYDRMQSLILGRPYQLNSKHWDTIMPEARPGECIEGTCLEFHRAKWSFAMLVGDLCDDCLSVGRPPYETILLYDRRIRAFKANLPEWLAYDPKEDASSGASLPVKADAQRKLYQKHHMTVMINETMLFLHRVAFANAIEHYPAEPLRSPWSQSVVSLCLEACRTLIAVAKSAFANYPKLAARWWHVQIHAFGAGVCLAAVCIKAPGSALIRVAWNELNEAMTLLENLAREGGHARDLHPRLRRLRDQAQAKLEAFQNSPPTSLSPHSQAGMDTSSSSGLHSQLGQAGHGAGRDGGYDGEKGGPVVKEEELEQLAVLGAATRKLEGNFVQRHQTAGGKKDGGPGGVHRERDRLHQHLDREREQPSSSVAAAGRSKDASHMPLDASTASHHAAFASRHATVTSSQSSSPSTTMFASRDPPSDFSHEQQQPQQQYQYQQENYPRSQQSQHVPQVSVHSAIEPAQQQQQQQQQAQQQPTAILPNPATYIQRYEELDAGLADVLASISESPDMQSGSLEMGGVDGIFAVPNMPLADPSAGMPPVVNQAACQTRPGYATPIGQPSLSGVSPTYHPQQQQHPPRIQQPLMDVQGSQYTQTGLYPQANQHVQQAGPKSSRISSLAPAYEVGMQRPVTSAYSASLPSWQSSYPARGQASFAPPDNRQPPNGANNSSATSPSQFSSPGHEYFERHPSVSAGAGEAGFGAGMSVQQHQQQHPQTAEVVLPVSGSRNSKGLAGAGNGYLDTAWMDYFPTPGVGLFQQAVPPPTPGLSYATPSSAGPGPSAQQPGQYEQTQPYAPAYYQQQVQQQQQQQQQQQPNGPYPPAGQARYYGIQQQMGQPLQQSSPAEVGAEQPTRQQQQQHQYGSMYGSRQ